jgi:pyruvate formate lyase activating enzyme
MTGKVVGDWHWEGERMQCDVCPRHCQLRDGQRGMCFVRVREGDEMVLATWGRSSGFCIDPIEKKPLNHFLPGTPVLSFGTAGCNLGCRYCQNWDMSKSREMDTLMARALPDELTQAALDHGCRSIAFTYNDPVIFYEYAVDVAKACRPAGIKTVAVTAGYLTQPVREKFFAHVDAANVDLKGFSEEFYRKTCLAELENVKETLRWLTHETEVWVEITTLLIPGYNDSDDELRAMAEWVVGELGPEVPWHFSAFHPDFKMRDVPRTPPATLRRAREIAMAAGSRYVYVGNVHDRDADSTWCPNCGQLLIERDWYVLGEWNLRDGCCPTCRTRCPGVFEEVPGTWGAKRQPIRIG